MPSKTELNSLSAKLREKLYTYLTENPTGEQKLRQQLRSFYTKHSVHEDLASAYRANIISCILDASKAEKLFDNLPDSIDHKQLLAHMEKFLKAEKSKSAPEAAHNAPPKKPRNLMDSFRYVSETIKNYSTKNDKNEELLRLNDTPASPVSGNEAVRPVKKKSSVFSFLNPRRQVNSSEDQPYVNIGDNISSPSASHQSPLSSPDVAASRHNNISSVALKKANEDQHNVSSTPLSSPAVRNVQPIPKPSSSAVDDEKEAVKPVTAVKHKEEAERSKIVIDKNPIVSPQPLSVVNPKTAHQQPHVVPIINGPKSDDLDILGLRSLSLNEHKTPFDDDEKSNTPPPAPTFARALPINHHRHNNSLPFDGFGGDDDDEKRPVTPPPFIPASEPIIRPQTQKSASPYVISPNTPPIRQSAPPSNFQPLSATQVLTPHNDVEKKLRTDLNKAKDYQTAVNVYVVNSSAEVEFVQNKKKTKFDASGKNGTIYWDDPLHIDDSRYQIIYQIQDGKITSVKGGESSNAILPPQKRNDNGFEVVTYHDGQPSYLISAGNGRSNINYLNHEGKKVEPNMLHTLGEARAALKTNLQMSHVEPSPSDIGHKDRLNAKNNVHDSVPSH